MRASTFFFLVLSLAVICVTWDIHTQIVPQVALSLEQTRQSAAQIAKDVDDLKVMTNSAMFQAEEVLHHTDELLEVEKGAQKAQLEKTNKVLDQLAHTIADIYESTQASLQPVAPLLEQTNYTLQGTQQLEAQLQENLKQLEPTESAVGDAATRAVEIAANLSNTTADVQHEVHKLVYPPPRKWYQKYLLDPLKLALHLITIPVTNL